MSYIHLMPNLIIILYYFLNLKNEYTFTELYLCVFSSSRYGIII